MAGGDLVTLSPRFKLVSPYHTLGEIQTTIFGISADNSESSAAILLAGAVTFFSMVIAYHRISGQLRQ